MIGLALFPLAVYFFLLGAFHFRRTPTVLSGEQDFMLLAGGLFGLMTFGPGRLLIPLNILTFWHIFAWGFWTLFYFLLAYMVTQYRRHRKTVIYHCPIPVFVPKLFELGCRFDPAARLDGNVLFLPGLGVQCTINGDLYGGHIILLETGSFQDRLRWLQFQRGVRSLCRTLPIPTFLPGNALFFTGLGCLFFTGGLYFADFPRLLEVFADYWF